MEENSDRNHPNTLLKTLQFSECMKSSAMNLAAAVLTDGVLLHATFNLLSRWHVSLRAKSWPFFFFFLHSMPIFTHPDGSQMKASCRLSDLCTCWCLETNGCGRNHGQYGLVSVGVDTDLLGKIQEKTHVKLEIRRVGLKWK